MISNLIQCNSTSLAPLIILRLTEGHTHTLSSENKKNCSRIEGEKWFFLPSLPRSENSSRFLVPLPLLQQYTLSGIELLDPGHLSGRERDEDGERKWEKERENERRRREKMREEGESSKGKTGTVISQNRLHSLFPSFYSHSLEISQSFPVTLESNSCLSSVSFLSTSFISFPLFFFPFFFFRSHDKPLRHIHP